MDKPQIELYLYHLEQLLSGIECMEEAIRAAKQSAMETGKIPEGADEVIVGLAKRIMSQAQGGNF